VQLSIPYALLGPDGTRIVLGNTPAAKADPDYIGWIDPDSGIAGLDSPDVIERAAAIIQGDGGIHYDFFHGRRPIVVNGVIDPLLMDTAGIAALEQKIKRATNAMRADALLSWTNTGFPERRLRLRRQSPPRITGRRPKQFQLALVDADYRVLSADENGPAAVALGTTLNVTNAGDETATARFEIVGPVPATLLIENLDTGLTIRFKSSFSLSTGQTLIVDTSPPYPVVTVDGVNGYEAIDFLETSWWGLRAGAQNVRARSTGGTTGTWRPLWRDAWI